MRISDWSSDVCSSDLDGGEREPVGGGRGADPAGRAELALVEGRGEALERLDAARGFGREEFEMRQPQIEPAHDVAGIGDAGQEGDAGLRSEEHTSELQSLMRISYAVFC